MAIKHALVLLFLVAVWYFGIHDQFEVVQKSIEPNYTNAAPNSGESIVASDVGVYKLIGTLSGLLLAGAISGFFRFTYKLCKEDGNFSPCLVFLGDLMTGLQLAVIGILLTLVVESINRYKFTKPLFSVFMLLGVVLYIALVLYDVYDYQNCQDTKK